MMMNRKKETKKLVILEEEGPLQNPDADRKLIIPACVVGHPCHKIFVDDAAGDAVCRAYLDPHAIQERMGSFTACGIKQNLEETEEVKKFVNPIKASKRGL